MEQRSMSIYALAKASGLPWQTVKNLVNQINNPTVSTVEMLCNGLGITMSQFFAEGEDEISLNSEQKYLLERWNCISEDEKRIFSALLDMIVKSKS
jgi:transcriptional regulator with XRE-family HTH domain